MFYCLLLKKNVFVACKIEFEKKNLIKLRYIQDRYGGSLLLNVHDVRLRKIG